MKKYYTLFAFSFILSGCMFEQPDYVNPISAAELNNIMQQQDIFLVDVHTPEQQHIKGTDAFIPYNAVEKYQDKLPSDKSTAIYLYCAGGPMGDTAAKTLHELGYQNISNLDGGAKAWQKAGFAFE
ncbi:MAG: rhodanese-like domain-containing protein [Methylomonas lenta]|nr:rhodanese-like domain-containing protein [Methylomonas lenta]